MSLRRVIFEKVNKCVGDINFSNMGLACFKPEGKFYCISLDEQFDDICQDRPLSLLTQYKPNIEKAIEGENVFLRIGVPDQNKDKLNYWLYEQGMWNIYSVYLPMKDRVYGIFISGGYDSVQHIESCLNQKENLIEGLKSIDFFIKSVLKDQISFLQGFKFNLPLEENFLEILSEREKQIIINLTFGLTKKEISKKLALSENSIKEYAKRAYEKLGNLSVRNYLISHRDYFYKCRKYLL